MERDAPAAEPGGIDTWETLVRRLLARALRLGASAEEAEDLVQDSLEVVVREPGWFDRSRASLLTVLTSVLRNRFIDRARHREVHRRTSPHLRLVEPMPAPGLAIEADQAAKARFALLSQLTPEERAVFGAWLRQRRREFTVDGAAAAVGMDAKDYEKAKKRLRRRCRSALADLDLEVADLFGPQEER